MSSEQFTKEQYVPKGARWDRLFSRDYAEAMNMKPKGYWTARDIKKIELIFPELKDRIQRDSMGAGRYAEGCYVSNAAGKLRNQGEHRLASLIERIAREGC